MISPTGKNTIRQDEVGQGHYGAKRGNRKHEGTDYVGIPGEAAVASISGVITRESKPYPGKWSGCVIKGSEMSVVEWYIKLDSGMIGRSVSQGERIGIIQDISEKYGPKCIPHVHLGILSFNPHIFIGLLG